MEQNLKLIKRVTKHKLKKDFDNIYDSIKKISSDEYDYKGEIKIIKSDKWVSFYMINEDIE